MASPRETKYYDILGVSPGCSADALKSAYRKAALRCHPDKVPPEKRAEAEVQFKEIGKAYEVLSNPETRRVYDMHGEKGAQNHGVYQGDDWFPDAPPAYAYTGMDGESHFFDPFEQSIFEAMFGKTADPYLPKADPLFADLDCTLEELYTGCTKHVSIERKRFVGSLFGGDMRIDSRDFDIPVKAGWRDGTRITYEGEGDAPAGLQAGDLIITVRELPHSFYRREGDDLHCTVWVWSLTSGSRTTIPFLDGTPMVVWDGKAPINPNEPRIVLERGMVNSKTGFRGDLYLHFRRKFPMFFVHRCWRFIAPKGRLPDWMWWSMAYIGAPLLLLTALRILGIVRLKRIVLIDSKTGLPIMRSPPLYML